MALSNSISNAASNFLGSIGNNLNGLANGTNSVTQPQLANILGFNIPGVPLVSMRDFFLLNMESWISAIPLQSQWIALIDPYPTALKSAIIRDLERTEGYNSAYDISSAKFALTNFLNQRIVGCVFSNGVTIPQEKYNISSVSVNNNRGFIPGIIASNRDSYSSGFNMTFLETNTSFIDFVIRPWVMLASHYGFVARPGDIPGKRDKNNIKCNITVLNFTRTYQSVSMVPRKVFRFYNCAPLSVSTQEYTYVEPDSPKSYAVQWAYSHYTIENNLYLPLPDIISRISNKDVPIISPLQNKGLNTNNLIGMI